MFRMFFISLILVVLLASFAVAENYAVLITGEHPDSTDGENQTWNGGQVDPDSCIDEFWNDTFLMWEMLW